MQENVSFHCYKITIQSCAMQEWNPIWWLAGCSSNFITCISSGDTRINNISKMTTSRREKFLAQYHEDEPGRCSHNVTYAERHRLTYIFCHTFVVLGSYITAWSYSKSTPLCCQWFSYMEKQDKLCDWQRNRYYNMKSTTFWVEMLCISSSLTFWR
jgi:hypothetical protein